MGFLDKIFGKKEVPEKTKVKEIQAAQPKITKEEMLQCKNHMDNDCKSGCEHFKKCRRIRKKIGQLGGKF